MLAEGEVSLLTVFTLHTGNQRCTGHSVSHLDLGNTFAYLDDITGKLMAQYDGIKMDAMVKDTRNCNYSTSD